MQIMKYIPKAIREIYSSKLFELFLSEQNEVFVGDGDGGSKRLCDITRDTPSSDRLSDEAAFNTYAYNGVVTSGSSGSAMGVRYKTTLNNQERNVGFIGVVQDNSVNAAVSFELHTRAISGEPELRYSITPLGENLFSTPILIGNDGFKLSPKDGSPTVLLLDLIDQRNLEIKSNGQTITTYSHHGRLEFAPEKELTFGGHFLRVKSKVGDPLTMQVEGVNQRNIELITNNAVRILINGNGDIAMPTLPTYADNAAAVTAGKSVGIMYKTAAGEVRIVV